MIMILILMVFYIVLCLASAACALIGTVSLFTTADPNLFGPTFAFYVCAGICFFVTGFLKHVHDKEHL